MAESKMQNHYHGLDMSRKIAMTLPYTCPCDGYIQIYGSGTASSTGAVAIDGIDVLAFAGDLFSGIVPVGAGQIISSHGMYAIYWANFFPCR